MKRKHVLRLPYYATILTLGTFTCVSTCYPQDKPGKDVPNELPRSWRLDEIAKATPPYGTEDPVYVLAWAITEDE